MGGRPHRVHTPPPEAPVPSPVPLDTELLEKERARRAQKVRKYGRAGTILNFGSLAGGEEQKLGVA